MNKPDRLWHHNIKLERFFKRFQGELNEDLRYDKDELSAFELVEVDLSDLEIGEIYINIDGHSLMCTDRDGDRILFKFITRSPINVYKGINVLDLEYGNQWSLFWILVKNQERGLEEYGI